jgi:hypothetical protein
MGSVKLNNSYSMSGKQRLADDECFIWPGGLYIGDRPTKVPTLTEIVILPIFECAFTLEVNFKKSFLQLSWV